mmetsp:Transcript_22843/g.40743  ORF Transcript_22843/g.40743 Transcript_22843/m.40743 type:complete len:110 (-) Transcript_22843:37-366(-)
MNPSSFGTSYSFSVWASCSSTACFFGTGLLPADLYSFSVKVSGLLADDRNSLGCFCEPDLLLNPFDDFAFLLELVLLPKPPDPMECVEIECLSMAEVPNGASFSPGRAG